MALASVLSGSGAGMQGAVSRTRWLWAPGGMTESRVILAAVAPGPESSETPRQQKLPAMQLRGPGWGEGWEQGQAPHPTPSREGLGTRPPG